jgi:undecaprenyl-diphosphatase
VPLQLHQIVVLAIVQGIFEFLPISSWAHLIMVPVVFGWPDQGLAIEMAVHVGTLVAVMLFFWRDMWRLARGGLVLLRGKLTADGRLLLLLAVATVPLVVASFVVKQHVEALRHSYQVIGFAMIGFGLVLYAADAAYMQLRRIDHMSWANALLFGLFQVIALVPGTSRSGITMTAGRFLGFERGEAARFSMLMSVPVGFGQLVLLLRDLSKAGTAQLGTDAVLAGALSFVTALLAIWFLMAWLKRASFGIFALYRLLAGGALLYWFYFLKAA